MANTHILLTPTVIAKEALRLLKNNLVMGSRVYRGYEEEFPGAPKKGGTMRIRKPVKFTVTKARTRTTSNIKEMYITVTVATQAHVSWQFYMSDLTLSIEEYSERYIRPAAAKLANTIDADLCGLYTDVYNVVWESTGFANPSTFMVLGKAMQRLDEEAGPPEDRCVVFNPAGHWAMANALAALSIPNIPEKAITKGYLGTIAGADIYMDQNIKSHTVGAFHESSAWTSIIQMGSGGTGIPASATVGDTGTKSMIMVGFRATDGSKTLRTGDWFQINGVYAVNPMSGESTGTFRQFVVTADASLANTSVGAPMTVAFEPNFIDTGPYKTVDTVPASGAVVYFWQKPESQIPQNLAFHKNAFALIMVPLEMPDSTWGSTVSEDGYSCRILKAYDIDQDEEAVRLDVFYGTKTIYPELAVRIAGATQGGV